MNSDLKKLYKDFEVDTTDELCKKVKLEILKKNKNKKQFVKINLEFQNKKFTLNLSRYISGYDFLFILQTKIKELFNININAYDMCILNKDTKKPLTHTIINKNNNEIFSLDFPINNYEDKIKKVIEDIVKISKEESEKKEEMSSNDSDISDLDLSDFSRESSKEEEKKEEFEEIVEQVDIFDVFEKNTKLSEKIFIYLEKINLIVFSRDDIKKYQDLYLPLKSNQKVSDEKIKKYVEKFEEVEKKFIMNQPKTKYIVYEFISKCNLLIKSDQISKNIDLVSLLHSFDCNDIHPYISLNLEEPNIQKTKVTNALLENKSLFQYWKNLRKNTILIKILHPQKFYYDFYIDEFSNIFIDFITSKNNLNIDIEDIYKLVEKDIPILLKKLNRYNVFKNKFILKKENLILKNIEKTFTLIMRNKFININEIQEYLDCLHTHITTKEITKSFPDTIIFNNHYLKDVDMKNKVYQLFWNIYYNQVQKDKVFDEFIYNRTTYINNILEKIPLNKNYVENLYSNFERNILKNESVFKSYQNTKLNPYQKFKSLVFKLDPYDKANGIYLVTVSNYNTIDETKDNNIKKFIENFINNYIENESIIDCKLKRQEEQKKLGINVNKIKKLKTYLKIDPKEIKYAKYCQKQRQPEIFYDDEEYKEYLKNNNQIENPEPIDFKGYKFLCPQPENNKVGFLKLDTHPQEKNLSGNAKREICLPCCFKEEQKVNEFCLGNIDYEEYEKYEKNQEKGFYIYKGKFPLTEKEVGDIPDILNNLLSDDNIILRRRGLKDTSFLNAVIYCYFKMKMCDVNINEKVKYNDTEKLKQIQKIKNYLKKNENYFKSLQPFIYEMNRGDRNRYIRDIKNNSLEPRFLIDLLSTVNTLTDDAINIVVLKTIKSLKKLDNGRQEEVVDMEIKCYQKELLRTNKYIILYTEDEQHFEPLYQPYRGRKCSLYIHDLSGKSFNVLLRDWYSKNCKKIEDIMTTNLKEKIKRYINPLGMRIKDINKKIITNENKVFTKNTYFEYVVDETEQRLLYELSYYVKDKPNYKKLIENATEKDSLEIAKMLATIFNLNKVVYEDEVNIKEQKDINFPNERKICGLNTTEKECNSSIFCGYVDNKCKIRLDKRLKGVYFRKIIDYIIRYRNIRDQILNNSFDNIRDRFIFQSSNKNTYIN